LSGGARPPGRRKARIGQGRPPKGRNAGLAPGASPACVFEGTVWPGRVSAPAFEKHEEASAIRLKTRTNDEITAREVRLIDEEGNQLGILPTAEAIERALAKNLDLVEVAPDGDPPVCRILDYTKFRYDQKRKQKAARKKVTKVDIKEIKLRPNIDPHDFSIKLQHAREFVAKGNKLKITVRYRRDEMRHYEIGSQKMDKMIEELKDMAVVESVSRGQEGLRMQTATLAPRPKVGGATAHDQGQPRLEIIGPMVVAFFFGHVEGDAQGLAAWND